MIQFIKSRIIYFWLTILLLWHANMYAQPVNDMVQDVQMPSANAVAFGKYGDIPVSQFTGIPNISVPITTIQEGTLSLPINLTYHASGIKVGELASWVGLGWNLNFGGQISRTVLGLNDECYSSSTSYRGYLNGGSSATATEIQGDRLKYVDTEPDLFSFTAGSYSGKFYIDVDKNVVLIPKQNVKIEFDPNTRVLDYFVVTTPEGTRYIYGKDPNDASILSVYEKHFDELRTTTGSRNDIKQIWHLVKIEDYKRKYWIKFNYEWENYQYLNLGTQTINNLSSSSTQPIQFGTRTDQEAIFRVEQGRVVEVQAGRSMPVNLTSVTRSQRLASITTSSGFTEILFNASTDREDLRAGVLRYPRSGMTMDQTKNPKRLDYIDIKTSAGDAYTKRFELDFDYLVDQSVQPTTAAEGYNKRLRLVSVTEVASNVNPILRSPPYIFQYQGNNQYPNRLYRGIDHWGFLNGFTQNNDTRTNAPESGARRESDESEMKKGILTKIIYPTRGSTTFVFEANRVKNGTVNKIVGGLRVRQLISSDEVDHSKDVITNYSYLNDNSTLSSGVLMVTPRYSWTIAPEPINTTDPTRRSGFNTIQDTKFFHAITSHPVVPLGDFTGYHIGYTHVVETKTGSGQTIYHFNQEDPFGLDHIVYAKYPSLPIPPRSKTGSLTFMTQTDVAGNIKSKTLNDESTIRYDDNETVYRMRIFKGSTFEVFVCTAYQLPKPSFFRQIQQTTVLDGVTTVKVHQYDNDKLSVPTKVTFVNSDGNSIETAYKYPADLATGTLSASNLDPYFWLVELNAYVTSPVETREMVNGQTVSGKKIGFGIDQTRYQFNQHVPLPTKFYNWQRASNNTMADWNLRGEITEFYPDGYPKTFRYDKWNLEETYQWNKGVMTEKRTGDFVWSFSYLLDNSRVLQKAVNENNIKTTYEYDPFLRLKRVNGKLDASGNPLAWVETAYRYKGINGASQNEIVSTTHFLNLDLGNSSPIISDLGLTTQQYYDELGRPTQKVKTLIDGTFSKNWVQYDGNGRVERTFDVFQENNNLFASISPFLYASKPHIRTVYESSPLNRPIQQITVGAIVSMIYGANEGGEVRLYKNGICTNNETYAANMLYKTVTIDEHGKPTTVFKDKMGQVILTRKLLNGDPVDTYNLYNDLGQLIAVLPPGCTNMDALAAFRYEYDFKNRLSRKRVPGTEWQYFYYDDRDLLVLKQDGNTRRANENKFLATLYDGLGRAIKTGWVYEPNKTEIGLRQLQILDDYALTKVTYNSVGAYIAKTEVRVLEGQNLTSWLTNEVLTRDEWGKPLQIKQTHLEGEDIIETRYNTADKPISVTRRHLGLNGANEVITQIMAYDRQLRPIETRQKFDGSLINIPEMLLSEMHYNFKDQLTEKNIGKNISRNQAFLQSIDYLYNARGWLTSINGLSMVAANDPDKTPIVKKGMDVSLLEPIEIGALGGYYESSSAYSNGNDDNVDLFSQVINYDQLVSGLHALPQNNGNISSTIWQVAGREKQGYGFKYDDLNRLTEAYYADLQESYVSRHWNRPDVTFSTDNIYKENVQYDVRGNIINLQRNGLMANSFTNNRYLAGDFGAIDNLYYGYNEKNQVTRIDDNAAVLDPNQPHAEKDFKGFVYKFDAAFLDEHYRYDANGNLTFDAHKDIERIEYNYMNLPAQIVFTDNRSITFIYDASGKKLRKTVSQNGQTEQRDYLDGIEYKNGIPDQFLHSEGSIHMDKGGQFRYYFVLRDHLGNTRVTFSDLNDDDKINEKEEIVQINNYYPFGLNHEGNINGAAGDNQYQYNGKELNVDFGLNWNDYGARFYDPAVSRWNTADPLAEKYFAASPYNMVLNNPILYIDPHGEDVYLFYFTKDNTRGDAMFWQAALTRALDVLNSESYDETKDKIVVKGITDLGALKETVEDDVKTWSPYYGKTKEVGIWSHSSLDGPTGTAPTSKHELDAKQMTMEGWADINFNWGDKSAMGVYGCRSGVETRKSKSFTERLSAQTNMADVTVLGQTDFSYPSSYTNIRATPTESKPYPTYMVGNGFTPSEWINRKMGTKNYAKPMRVSMNGQTIGFKHQKGSVWER